MIKNKLKEWRYKSQMERAEFATFLGVNYNHYTRWENNTVQPSLESLIKIRNELKKQFPEITLDELIE